MENLDILIIKSGITMATFGYLLLYVAWRRSKYAISSNIYPDEHYRNNQAKTTWDISQERFREIKPAYIGHGLIIYGMITFFLATILGIVDQTLWIITGTHLLSGILWDIQIIISDIGQVLIFISAVIYIARRASRGNKNLKKNLYAFLPMIFLTISVVSSVLASGFYMAYNGNREVVSWLAYPIGIILQGKVISSWSYEMAAWISFVCAILFGLSFCRSNLLHAMMGFRNLKLIGDESLGRLSNLDDGAFDSIGNLKEETAEELHIGISKISDLSKLELLQLDCCVECGRCNGKCPANQSGGLLAPRELLQIEKKYFNEYKKNKSRNLATDLVLADMIWECHNCYACENACPMLISHVDKIVRLRRAHVFAQGKADGQMAEVIRKYAVAGNPFGSSVKDSTIDTVDLPIYKKGVSYEYLLWLGCHGHFNPRFGIVVKNLVTLLKKAHVSFGILDDGSLCCGDPIRRVGEEALFQKTMRHNIQVFQEYNVKKIITLCPHCYNSFSKDYESYGYSGQILHYSQMLHIIMQGKRKEIECDSRIYYHNACYLGRINGLYEQPRAVLSSYLRRGELLTLDGAEGGELCCGAGGGHIWSTKLLNEAPSTKIVENLMRKKTNTIITSCPYCLTVFEKTCSRLNADIKVCDLLEFIGAEYR